MEFFLLIFHLKILGSLNQTMYGLSFSILLAILVSWLFFIKLNGHGNF